MIGPTIALDTVMRLVSLAVIASLAVAPGCAALAVPPIMGATSGIIIGSSSNHGAVGAAVGTAIGLLADVVVAVAVLSIVDETIDEIVPDCARCR